MAQLSRKGDKDAIGNKIARGADTVFVNNKPVALHTSDVTGKMPTKTSEGSPSVFAENVPVLRVGSKEANGKKIIEGSSDVNVP